MTRRSADDMAEPLSRYLRAGLRVSLASVGWTVTAGTCAVVIGITGDSLVLVAFGLIGLLDGIGSGALVVHFRHSQRRRAISERHERVALIVVTAGMASVGIATVADSIERLITHAASRPSPPGVVLTGLSVLVLALLARRKRTVALRIPSHALHADGWLSTLGAGLAGVALAGTGLDAAFGWWWVDAGAATALGCAATGLSIALARGIPLQPA